MSRPKERISDLVQPTPDTSNQWRVSSSSSSSFFKAESLASSIIIIISLHRVHSRAAGLGYHLEAQWIYMLFLGEEEKVGCTPPSYLNLLDNDDRKNRLGHITPGGPSAAQQRHNAEECARRFFFLFFFVFLFFDWCACLLSSLTHTHTHTHEERRKRLLFLFVLKGEASLHSNERLVGSLRLPRPIGGRPLLLGPDICHRWHSHLSHPGPSGGFTLSLSPYVSPPFSV